MSPTNRKWVIALVIVLAAVILMAGTWLIAWFFFAPGWNARGGMMNPPGPAGRQGNNRFDNRRYNSNGEQIYFTGTSQTGPPITSQMRGAPGMGMMGGELACAGCHGANGEGGTVTMMMQSFEVPNIQYDHLTMEEHAEGGEEHPPYTDETIKRAITEGVDPAGEPLEWPMPRWNMTDAQLNDLIAYLKTLH